MSRPVNMFIEFTDYQRPRLLASRTRMSGLDIGAALSCDPVLAGTRMRWSWELRPRGLLKLLTLLVGPIGGWQEAAIWAGLKRVLEAQPLPQPQS